MPEKNQNFILEGGVLYNKDKTELIWFPTELKVKDVVIPDSVEFIDNDQLAKQNYMETLYVPARCTLCDRKTWEKRTDEIDYDLWVEIDCPKLREFKAASDQPYFKVKDGVLFSNDMKILFCYPSEKKDTTYEIPNLVRVAPFGNANSYLEKLVVSKNVYQLAERVSRSYELYGDGLLKYSALKSIENDGQNKTYTCIDGILYKQYAKTTELVVYPAGKDNTDFFLPTNAIAIHELRYLTENPFLKRVILDVDSEYNRIENGKLFIGYRDAGIELYGVELTYK